MQRKFLLVCVTATLAIGLGWQASAFAGGNDHHHGYGPHGPMITASSSVTDPGDSLTVNCKNFAPNEKITFTLDSHPVFLGQTTSNGNGSCFITVTIPSNTKAGEHTIVATGATGDSASTEIIVVIPRHRQYEDYGGYGDSVWAPFFT